MENKNKPVIGISIGDVNGIGLEVIIKTFTDNRMLQFCTPVIYGSLSTLNYHRKALDNRSFTVHNIQRIEQVHPNRINLLQVWEENVRITLGEPNPEAGKYAFLSLKSAVEDAKAGKLDAIVTAPIDKFTIQSEEFQFPGHTEYLAKEFESKTLMLLVGESFRIGVVTGHIPINEVSGHINKDRILEKIYLMHDCLLRDFGIRKPKIAVLGLNPHAGEEGLLGTEEKDIIIPAIEEAKNDEILAFGPFPADGFFGTHMYKNFDGILAMYHDQGLVPFKLMNFETGVNYTAGLQVPRTSPDHGTAYSIAGKNIADERSFREAIYLAAEIVRTRQREDEIHSNPLQSRIVKEKEL